MHATIADQLLDLVQNALEAGATVVNVVWLEKDDGTLSVRVADNGRGMSPELQAKVFDPFYTDGQKHRHRKVGLGLPFLRQMVEAAGGELTLASQVGKGTDLHFKVDAKHVDLPPPGNLVDLLSGLMAFTGAYDCRIERERAGRSYHISRIELLEVLGELDTADSLVLLRDYIASQEEALMQKG